MVFKRIARSLGWTKETRKELSDLLHDTAVVSKEHVSAKNGLATGTAIGVATGNLAMGVALGSAMSQPERNYINFTGKKVSFSLDDKDLYDLFEDGEKVKVSYREVYEELYDYVPPDFENKRFLERTCSGYRFVSAEKL